MNALNGHNCFPYDYDSWTVIDVRDPSKMIWRLPDGFKEKVGGSDNRPIHIDEFADICMTLELAKAALEQFCQKEEDYFGIPSLKAQNSISNSTSPTHSAVHVPDAGATDAVVTAVLGVDDDWDFKRVDALHEVYNGTVKNRSR